MYVFWILTIGIRSRNKREKTISSACASFYPAANISMPFTPSFFIPPRGVKSCLVGVIHIKYNVLSGRYTVPLINDAADFNLWAGLIETGKCIGTGKLLKRHGSFINRFAPFATIAHFN